MKARAGRGIFREERHFEIESGSRVSARVLNKTVSVDKGSLLDGRSESKDNEATKSRVV